MKKLQSRKETTLRRRTEHGCAECGKTFTEKRTLVDHVTDIHTGKKVCPLCQESFRNFNIYMIQFHIMQGANCACCNMKK